MEGFAVPGPTIVDVAKRAHVSRSTASLALGPQADKVSEQTRRLVIAAATELGYRANPAGAALRTGRGGEVAFVYHELSEFEMQHGSGPMWARFAMLLGMDLGSSGYRLLMLAKADCDTEPLSANAVLAFAEDDGQIQLPDLRFGTPVWVATTHALDESFSRVCHDYPLIAAEVLHYIREASKTKDDQKVRIAMCVRGVEDPPLTHAMEAALLEAVDQTGDEFVARRVDPRDTHAIESFCSYVQEEKFDAVLCWGMPLIPLTNRATSTDHSPLVVAFSENELPPEFPAGTPHVSFCLDAAARQLASAVVQTMEGEPQSDICFAHATNFK